MKFALARTTRGALAFSLVILLSIGCGPKMGGGSPDLGIGGPDGGAADLATGDLWSAAPDLAPAGPAFTAQNGGAFVYGRHYPNGQAAVSYAYGPDGMWKPMNPLEYKWNYYGYGNDPNGPDVLPAPPPANHPTNQSMLIAYADGTHFTTSLDPNGHLLWDLDHDGEIDTASGGYAFCEHNARGVGNKVSGKPFTQFWYDDNLLAHFMSQAYAQPLASGLSKYSDFTRWQVVGGDPANWSPYGGNYFDQLALNGLYYLAKNDLTNALVAWDAIISLANPQYDGGNQRYSYSINENYHLGLVTILAANLLAQNGLDTNRRPVILQHFIALRSNILSNQESNGSGTLYGWVTGIGNTSSLMNIESLATNVLALGATANAVFEAGLSPLSMDNGYYLRPHHVLSGVTGMSQSGYMTRGPGWSIPLGNYQVDFFLRAPAPVGKMATIDVWDDISNKSLVTRDINAADMAAGNTWSQVTVALPITAANSQIEIRTYWYATANMDVAAVRVR